MNANVAAIILRPTNPTLNDASAGCRMRRDSAKSQSAIAMSTIAEAQESTAWAGALGHAATRLPISENKTAVGVPAASKLSKRTGRTLKGPPNLDSFFTKAVAVYPRVRDSPKVQR